jgi:hypothetical protein
MAGTSLKRLLRLVILAVLVLLALPCVLAPFYAFGKRSPR